jgi:hypothetical protein
MGRLKGTRLNQTKLRLKTTQRFDDPKMITPIIASFMSISLMHSKSFGLESEERFGFYKKKLYVDISSPFDLHPLTKCRGHKCNVW